MENPFAIPGSNGEDELEAIVYERTGDAADRVTDLTSCTKASREFAVTLLMGAACFSAHLKSLPVPDRRMPKKFEIGLHETTQRKILVKTVTAETARHGAPMLNVGATACYGCARDTFQGSVAVNGSWWSEFVTRFGKWRPTALIAACPAASWWGTWSSQR